MTYIILVFIIFILGLFKKQIKQKKLIDVVIILIMTIIYGTRCDVGTDYTSYELYYNAFSEWPGSKELLFDLLVFLFRSLNMPFWVFCLFIGFAIFFMLYLIGKDLDIPYEKIIIFFILTGQLFVSFNLVRQTIAGVLVLFAFRYITIANFRKYLLYIIIATFIHTTSFVFMPFYFIKNININRWAGFVLFGIGVVLYFTDAINLFMQLATLIIPEKYLSYLGGKYDYNVEPGFGVLFYIIVAIVVWSSTSKNNRDKMYPFSMAYVLGYSIFLFTLNSFIVNRLTDYSKLAFVPVLPHLLNMHRGRDSLMLYVNIAITLAYVLIFLYIIWGIYGSDTQNLMYKNVFF